MTRQSTAQHSTEHSTALVGSHESQQQGLRQEPFHEHLYRTAMLIAQRSAHSHPDPQILYSSNPVPSRRAAAVGVHLIGGCAVLASATASSDRAAGPSSSAPSTAAASTRTYTHTHTHHNLGQRVKVLGKVNVLVWIETSDVLCNIRLLILIQLYHGLRAVCAGVRRSWLRCDTSTCNSDCQISAARPTLRQHASQWLAARCLLTRARQSL